MRKELSEKLKDCQKCFLYSHVEIVNGFETIQCFYKDPFVATTYYSIQRGCNLVKGERVKKESEISTLESTKRDNHKLRRNRIFYLCR